MTQSAIPPRTNLPQQTLPELVDFVADDSFLTDDDSPFRAQVTHASPHLAVVAGENAAGKSLFTKVVAAKARLEAMTPVTVSIRERTGGGMAKAFMFGDEENQSTGAATINAVVGAFKNLHQPGGSVLILDEPDLGLSEGYATALGHYIAQQAEVLPDVCAGILVVTHSRALVRGLADAYSGVPTFVHLTTTGHPGDGAADAPAPAGLQDWLDRPEARSIEELLELPKTGVLRMRAVLKLLKSHRD